MITALNGVIASSIASVSYDADAQLFFNAEAAAGVTLTTTEKNAVNQWVVDSKAANIWTKFKAIYPMVGSTATSQKFNLKNPLDTNAAFRLSFVGGGTHSSNGYQPNGVNAYANTFCTTANMALNSAHHSFYSRTDQAAANANEMGVYQTTPNCNTSLILKSQTGIGLIGKINNSGTGTTTTANSNSTGFYITSRTASNLTKTFKNNSLFQTTTQLSGAVSTNPYFISANNNQGSPSNYSSKECAFSTIGDGLTDLESQLFYQITEKYQVALSRNINTTQSFYYNSAYNNETNAFLFSTQITDNTIQTATNTLVTDLKTAGVFTKMKALYPMVGGTATTHKFNLVNAQDSTTAFALAFVGGWTHSSNGALPNGTNAYANTFLSSGTNLSLNSGHLSYYSRTNTVSASVKIDMGSLKSIPDSYTDLVLGSSNLTYFRFNNGAAYNSIPATNTLGFYTGSRTAVTTIKTYKNGAIIINGTAVSSSTSSIPFFIGASNNNGTAQYFSNNQCAFASIGDGLLDSEALAFYNAVQTFQTTLGRQV
jgi:hypothetical protein